MGRAIRDTGVRADSAAESAWVKCVSCAWCRPWAVARLGAWARGGASGRPTIRRAWRALFRHRVNQANARCFSSRKQSAFMAPRNVHRAAPKGCEFGTFDR